MRPGEERRYKNRETPRKGFKVPFFRKFWRPSGSGLVDTTLEALEELNDCGELNEVYWQVTGYGVDKDRFWTPLEHVVCSGDIVPVRHLLEMGVDVSLCDFIHGLSPCTPKHIPPTKEILELLHSFGWDMKGCEGLGTVAQEFVLSKHKS